MESGLLTFVSPSVSLYLCACSAHLCVQFAQGFFSFFSGINRNKSRGLIFAGAVVFNSGF